MLSALHTGQLYLKVTSILLISVRGWFDRQGELSESKISKTPSGIEHVVIRHVAISQQPSSTPCSITAKLILPIKCIYMLHLILKTSKDFLPTQNHFLLIDLCSTLFSYGFRSSFFISLSIYALKYDNIEQAFTSLLCHTLIEKILHKLLFPIYIFPH